VPTTGGKRGNPVVWSRRFFPELAALEGDTGARHLIASFPEAITDVLLSGTAALIDVDTPDALQAVKAEIERA
jgi:molybdenum cofactor cytidylyltransferase